jgi:NADH-quinone oxidoreductase subunit I
MSAIGTYFKEIFEVVQSTRKGMALTWKHAWNARKRRSVHQIQDSAYFQNPDGIVTLEYPNVEIPTPVNGRYQLHNEMDDCIVCDKCVKVCPVDCIDIEPIKATGLVGHTSDGSPIRLYAAKFDIDMSKCCFCGLCTTVCPTECLTMTSEYDFSVFEVKDHNFSFANLTPEQADEKRKLYEQFVAEKAEMKAGASQQSLVASPHSEGETPKEDNDSSESEFQGPMTNDQSPTTKSKPAFKPGFKPKAVASQQSLVASPQSEGERPKEDNDSSESEFQGPMTNDQSPTTKSKPAFKPGFKPKAVASQQSLVASPQSEGESPKEENDSSESEFQGLMTNDQSPTTKPKPAFKPSFKKPVIPKSDDPSPTSND